MLDKEIEKWVDKKMEEFKLNPTETLLNELESLTYVVKQYMDNQNSKAAKSVVDSALCCYKLLLDKIKDEL